MDLVDAMRRVAEQEAELTEALEFQREVEELLLGNPALMRKLKALCEPDTFVITSRQLEGVVFLGPIEEKFKAQENELAAQIRENHNAVQRLNSELETVRNGIHGLTSLETRCLALRKAIERACGTGHNVRMALNSLRIPQDYRDARGQGIRNYRAFKKEILHTALTLCNSVIHELDSHTWTIDGVPKNQRYCLESAEHLFRTAYDLGR
jgi:hypothetical protein